MSETALRPGKFHLGFTEDNYNFEDQRVVVKCSKCPRWAGQVTTRSQAAEVHRLHRELRHG